jgi:hypothetical protein
MNPDEMEANEESREADAQTQRALHQALDALKSAFGAGHKVPKSLDDASTDMDHAVDALKSGTEPAARTAEARAVDDLRKGGQQMAQQMQSAGSGQLALIPGGGEPGSEGDEAGMDPNGPAPTPRAPTPPTTTASTSPTKWKPAAAALSRRSSGAAKPIASGRATSWIISIGC